jgi:hypothetical protein
MYNGNAACLLGKTRLKEIDANLKYLKIAPDLGAVSYALGFMIK